MQSEVNHPESNRPRSTCEGDLQQLGVYRRFVTTRLWRPTQEKESIPFGKGSFALSRSPKFTRRDYLRLMLYALTSVNVDGLIYGRRSALSAAGSRNLSSLSPRGDVCIIRSTIIALLVRLFGDTPVVSVPFLRGRSSRSERQLDSRDRWSNLDRSLASLSLKREIERKILSSRQYISSSI